MFLNCVKELEYPEKTNTLGDHPNSREKDHQCQETHDLAARLLFSKVDPLKGNKKKKQQLQYVKEGTVCYHGGMTIILPTRGGAAKTFTQRQIFYFIVRPH